jgi:hypothetical protein
MRRLGVAVTVSLLLALALAAPASAFVLLELSGNHGDFGTKPATSDGPESPGAKCIYGAPDANGFAHLTKIKVFPVLAIAYDQTGSADSQPIRFKVTAQRSVDGGATWKNVRSVSQTRTATDTSSASFASCSTSARTQLATWSITSPPMATARSRRSTSDWSTVFEM